VAVLASYHAIPIALARDEKRSPFVGLQEGISPEQGPMSLACGRLPRKSVPGLASSGRSPCHFGWLVRNARRNGRVPRSRARHLGRCRHQARVPIKGWSPCRWQIVPGAVGFMSCWQIVPGASAPRRLVASKRQGWFDLHAIKRHFQIGARNAVAMKVSLSEAPRFHNALLSN
jgi:hypothetical protein